MSEMPATSKVRITKPNSAQQVFIDTFHYIISFFSNGFAYRRQMLLLIGRKKIPLWLIMKCPKNISNGGVIH